MVIYGVWRPTTTTLLTVAACHHLHHFFTLTHLTILPIAIVKDDDQHHRRHLSSSQAVRGKSCSCDDQPLHNPLSRRSDGGSQARRTAHLL